MNLKLLSILSFLSLFILSCDFKDDDLIIKDNEVYEFSWCSYKESKTPAELNKESNSFLDIFLQGKEGVQEIYMVKM